MKTVFDAIDSVYPLIRNLFNDCAIYKQFKPDSDKPDTWIVINSLPVNEGILQTCSVNVNIHVKELQKGKPDHEKLKYMTDAVIALFPIVTGDVHLYFGRQSIIRENQFQTNYSNIVLNAYLLNS